MLCCLSSLVHSVPQILRECEYCSVTFRWTPESLTRFQLQAASRHDSGPIGDGDGDEMMMTAGD